jgi:hypothetical protein
MSARFSKVNPMQTIATLFPRYGLAVSWLLSVVWMEYDYLGDPENNTLHGHNYPGTFEFMIKLGLIELCILYFILNPWVRTRDFGNSCTQSLNGDCPNLTNFHP